MTEEKNEEKQQGKAAFPAGALIARRRRELGLSQEALAEKLDVSRQAVAKWETGQTFPTAERLAELCRVLDLSPGELFGFSGQEAEDVSGKKKRSPWAVLFIAGLVLIWGVGTVLNLLHSGDLYDGSVFWSLLNLSLLWCLVFFIGLVARALLKYVRS